VNAKLSFFDKFTTTGTVVVNLSKIESFVQWQQQICESVLFMICSSQHQRAASSAE